jgi:hypothetical protein
MMQPPDVPVSAPRARFGPLYRSLIVSIVVPLVVVQVLLHRDVPAVTALAVAAIFPFADALRELVQARRLALLPTLSLLAIVVGIGMSFLSGNAAFAVARESIITAIFGVVFLGSLATDKPLIYRFARQFSGDGADSAARWDGMWAIEGVRRTFRLMTLVWGVGLLVEAALRVVVAFMLPVATSTIVSPLLAAVAFGGLVAWTVAYTRIARRRASERGIVLAS